jgi:prepilin-type N-terminal cleavage/methylation domain-containing protein
MRPRYGHTMIELLAVLMLLSILLVLSMPGVARWRDAAAVSAARDNLAARLAWTRVAAASRGGAALVLELPAGRYRVELADGLAVHETDLSERFGVTIRTTGPADSVVLRYDALGIGRMTARTLEVRRGEAVRGLTVSAYGRFRRW